MATEQHNHQAGHTLVELVVGLGIMVTVSSLVTYALIDGWQALLVLRARNGLVAELENANRRIDLFTRAATALPAQGTVQGTAYTANSTTLILTAPSVLADGTVIAASTDTVVFTVEPAGLVEILEPGGGSRDRHRRVIVPAPVSVTMTQSVATKPRIDVELTATRTAPHQTLTRSSSLRSIARNAE